MAGADLTPADEQALYKQLRDREAQINTYRVQAATNPRYAAAATAIHSAAPGVAPGVVYAMVNAVAEHFASLQDAVGAAMVADIRQSKKSWVDRLADDLQPWTATKGLVRTGLGVVQSGLQVVQQVGSTIGRGLADAANPQHVSNMSRGANAVPTVTPPSDANLSPANLLMSTTAGQMAKSLVTEGDLGQQGQGFFPGGEQEKRRQVAERAFRGTIPGTARIDPRTGMPIPGTEQSASVGRIMAASVVEPGSSQYRVMSGLADAAVAWYGDPGNYALKGFTAVKESRNLITAVKALEDSDFAKVLRPGEKLIDSAEKGGRGVYRSVPTPTGTGKVVNRRTWVPIEQIASDARVARQQEAGLVHGATRWTVQGKTSEEFLQTRKGQAIVRSIAEDGDWLSIHNALDRKVAPEVINRLTDAKTPEAVREVLYDVLGTSVRSTGDISRTDPRRLSAAFKHVHGPGWVDRQRFTQAFPDAKLGTRYDMSELEQLMSVNNLDSHLSNAKVSWETRSKTAEQFARGLTTDKGDRFAAVKNGLRAIETSLVEGYGVDKKLARALTTWKDDQLIRRYATAADGTPTDFALLHMDGTLNLNEDVTQAVRNLGPQLLSEGLGDSLTLPGDLRTIRRLTSHARVLTGTKEGQLRTPIAIVDYLQSTIWKKLAIARPAFFVRVIGDEQMRMSAAGLSSMFRHPLDWIQFAMHHSGQFDAMGNDFKLLGEFASDAGNWDAYNQGLHRGFGRRGVRVSVDPIAGEERSYFTGGYDLVNKLTHRDQYVVAASDEWRQMFRDPTASRIADGLTDDELIKWFKSKEGKPAYRQLIADKKHAVATNMVTGERVRMNRDMTDTNELRKYIGEVRERVKVKAGQDPEILGAIAKGSLGSEEITVANKELRGQVFDPKNYIGSKARLPDGRVGTIVAMGEKKGTTIVDVGGRAWDHTGEPSEQLLAVAERFRDSPASPEVMKYASRAKDSSAGFRGEAAARTKDAMDRAVQGFFSAGYGRSSDYLSRSPAFRQFYWKRMTELADNLSPEEANLFLRNVEEAATRHAGGSVPELLGGDVAVGKAIEKAKLADGSFTVEELDNYAKGHALDQLNKLLYDASRRNQFFDIARIVFPFGEAWKEVLQSWGKILVEHPSAVRRTQVLVQGARGFDPDGNGVGFFHVDPTTGQEVYTYPFSREVSRFLTGHNPVTSALDHVPVLSRLVANSDTPISMDFNGSVQGLNIGLGVVPGLGPVMQVPASMILRDKPQLDFVKAVILPYGDTSLSSNLALPSWAAKILGGVADSPDSPGIYGDTFSRTVQYLAGTGKYGNTADEQDRLRRDATQQARALTVLRGIVQSSGPSSPSIDFEAVTKNGNAMASGMIKEFQRLRAEDPRTALEQFQRLYGEEWTSFTVSRTKSEIGGLDVSTEFGRFERDNASLFRLFPKVAGFMAPTGTTFDFEVYNRQLASGKRKKLSAEEFLSAVNDTIVNQRYYDVKDAIDAQNAATGAHTSAEQRAFLADFKARLYQDYPATPDEGITKDLPTTIRQLGDAVDSKFLADNPVAATTREYLAIRDAAIASAAARRSTLGSQASADIRDVLFQVGTKMTKENPQFARLWQRVLSREVD